jgi:hypothetical protein
VHQDKADLAAGGATPLYPGFIPGGSAYAGEQLMRRPWPQMGHGLSEKGLARVHAGAPVIPARGSPNGC